MPGKHYPKNMRAGETTTEYRNRLSGKPGPISKKLIKERKENILKKKAEEIQAGKDHVANIKAKLGANKYGSYKMYPGKHSAVNPGNFRGSEVKKYGAMKRHPMKMVDISKVAPGQQRLIQGIVAKGKASKYNPGKHH